jgi:hypothetical protein
MRQGTSSDSKSRARPSRVAYYRFGFIRSDIDPKTIPHNEKYIALYCGGRMAQAAPVLPQSEVHPNRGEAARPASLTLRDIYIERPNGTQVPSQETQRCWEARGNSRAGSLRNQRVRRRKPSVAPGFELSNSHRQRTASSVPLCIGAGHN